MSKGKMKKSQVQARIYQLEIKKRNGLIVFASALIGMVVLIALKLYFQYTLNAEWANSQFASLGLFVVAIVAAGVAGWGTRSWRKARDEIRMLEGKFKIK